MWQRSVFLDHSLHLVGHQQLFSSLGAGDMSDWTAEWGGRRQRERRRKRRKATRADGPDDCFALKIRSNLWMGKAGPLTRMQASLMLEQQTEQRRTRDKNGHARTQGCVRDVRTTQLWEMSAMFRGEQTKQRSHETFHQSTRRLSFISIQTALIESCTCLVASEIKWNLLFTRSSQKLIKARKSKQTKKLETIIR